MHRRRPGFQGYDRVIHCINFNMLFLSLELRRSSSGGAMHRASKLADHDEDLCNLPQETCLRACPYFGTSATQELLMFLRSVQFASLC